MKYRVQKLRFFAWLLVAGLASGPAVAQSSASDTAAASATILTPISIAKKVDMNFGNVVAGSTAGTILLTTAGQRSVVAGGATFMSTQAGTVTAAEFTVSGASAATYTVTLPDSAILNRTVPSAATMTVNAFTSEPATTGTLTADGTQALFVGGTLIVGQTQGAGSYTGNFPVSVAYN